MGQQASRPVVFHLGLSFALAVLVCIGLWVGVGRHWALAAWAGCWLVAINVISFAYYGYDKNRARHEGRRVPELVLHSLTAAGGSLGSYAGMSFFRHKTIKGKFRILFWCIAAMQLALAAWIVKKVWWG